MEERINNAIEDWSLKIKEELIFSKSSSANKTDLSLIDNRWHKNSKKLLANPKSAVKKFKSLKYTMTRRADVEKKLKTYPDIKKKYFLLLLIFWINCKNILIIVIK